MSDTLPDTVLDALGVYRNALVDARHDAIAARSADAARGVLLHAIAAHVAAEVAAERARCAVPEVVRDAVEWSLCDPADRRSVNHPDPVAIRAWLAALPPITPEAP